MARLVVSNVDPAIVRALERRAAAKGISPEAAHLEVLRDALLPRTALDGFKLALQSFPDVGEDAAFETGGGNRTPSRDSVWDT